MLDAWVAEHQGRIEQRFSALATVEQRRHHLGLPVKVGNKLEPELTPERLRALDGLDRLVLISGEGGVGKTSLALRIAGWALEGRLTERAVVPVLVEADLQGEESLLSRVRSSLEALTEQRGPEARALAPTLPLVRALLERRRLLVILDHFAPAALLSFPHTMPASSSSRGELPIIQATMDLIQWFVPLLNRLPRDHRFALGGRPLCQRQAGTPRQQAVER